MSVTKSLAATPSTGFHGQCDDPKVFRIDHYVHLDVHDRVGAINDPAIEQLDEYVLVLEGNNVKITAAGVDTPHNGSLEEAVLACVRVGGGFLDGK